MQPTPVRMLALGRVRVGIWGVLVRARRIRSVCVVALEGVGSVVVVVALTWTSLGN